MHIGTSFAVTAEAGKKVSAGASYGDTVMLQWPLASGFFSTFSGNATAGNYFSVTNNVRIVGGAFRMYQINPVDFVVAIMTGSDAGATVTAIEKVSLIPETATNSDNFATLTTPLVVPAGSVIFAGLTRTDSADNANIGMRYMTGAYDSVSDDNVNYLPGTQLFTTNNLQIGDSRSGTSGNLRAVKVSYQAQL